MQHDETLHRRSTAAGPISYRSSGSGPAIMLIHGWGSSSRYWAGAPALLRQPYRLIAPDLPGFGATPPPPGTTTLDSLTESVLALADALELESFALVGHSLGAGVALLAAARTPTRTRRLGLISFGVARDQLEAQMMSGLHMQQRSSAALWGPWLALWRPWLAASQPWREWFWTQPPLAEMLAMPMIQAAIPRDMLVSGVADLSRMDARVAWESAATSGNPQVSMQAALVDTPTLLINGVGDPIFPPAAARALQTLIPQAQLELLSACGHVPMAETPARFYALLDAFLAA